MPVPRPVTGEVLVKILQTGVCGTDLQITRWSPWAERTIFPPLTLGHEFVGEIVAAGPETGGFVPGQLISAEGHVVCGRCRHCRAAHGHLCAETRRIGVDRDGVFTEYATLPAVTVWHHPPGHRTGHRDPVRPVRQRRPRRHPVPSSRPGRGDHRGRSDRADGHPRASAPARSCGRGRRPQPVPPHPRQRTGGHIRL
ncbi:alcohol dehydrogenase catalytic domain-containing protein [Actinomadura sp. 9N215]|uniref:alcohol dehydrogenase catalytic domain-containing protein n=1 Tax=Actinomadura sp. 9N215 TaxID=3375150 RepID=UPI0037A2F0FC